MSDIAILIVNHQATMQVKDGTSVLSASTPLRFILVRTLVLMTLVYTHAMTVMKKTGPIKLKWWAAVSRLVGLGMLCTIWISCSREPLFMQVPGHQEERLQTVSTGDVTLTVDPGAFHSFKFVVPRDHEDANLKGRFSLVSRGADGIRAFLLNEEDYANWQKGNTTYRYYDSGSVRQAYLDVPLLAWSAGAYYLVFDNQSQATTPKIITANLNLTYSVMWWPGKER